VRHGQSTHRGAGVDGSSMAETWDKARGNGLGVKAIAPLHLKLHGMAGNRGLTGEACGVVEEHGVDGEVQLGDSAKSFKRP
jgi:hypothetical protein